MTEMDRSLGRRGHKRRAMARITLTGATGELDKLNDAILGENRTVHSARQPMYNTWDGASALPSREPGGEMMEGDGDDAVPDPPVAGDFPPAVNGKDLTGGSDLDSAGGAGGAVQGKDAEGEALVPAGVEALFGLSAAAATAAPEALVPAGVEALFGLSAAAATAAPTAAAYDDDDEGGAASEDGGGRIHRPCSNCRSSRVLCDRGMPCGRCVRLGLSRTCQAPPTVKRGRPSKLVQQARLEQLAADQLATVLPSMAGKVGTHGEMGAEGAFGLVTCGTQAGSYLCGQSLHASMNRGASTGEMGVMAMGRSTAVTGLPRQTHLAPPLGLERRSYTSTACQTGGEVTAADTAAGMAGVCLDVVDDVGASHGAMRGGGPPLMPEQMQMHMLAQMPYALPHGHPHPHGHPPHPHGHPPHPHGHGAHGAHGAHGGVATMHREAMQAGRGMLGGAPMQGGAPMAVAEQQTGGQQYVDRINALRAQLLAVGLEPCA